jgi:hypothetical protein
VVKAKPKSPSRDEARFEARSSEASLAGPDSDHAVSGSAVSASSEPPSLPQAGSDAATDAPIAVSENSDPAQDRQAPAANVQATPTDIRKPAEAGSQAVSAVSPAIVTKPVKRRLARQAGERSEKSGLEKSGLVVMTLRTIEFPDGRRATQLIPYRGARALASEPFE